MAGEDLHGRIALITGGTRGIGRATAEGLARRGAHVVLVGRNAAVGEQSAAGIRAAGGTADYLAADLSLLREARTLAATVLARYDRLDLVVHSADVLRSKRLDTEEGLEVCFTTNYLSRFLLDNLLLDRLKASAPARIVHVAAAGLPGRLDLDQVPPRPGTSSFKGHNLGQKANDVFTVEFASRLAGTGVTINVMNPGMVDTDIRRNAADGAVWMRVMERVLGRMAATPERFAEQVLRLLTAPELEGVSGRLVNRKGAFMRIGAGTRDPATRRRLWERSARLTGLAAAPLKAG